MTSRPSPTPTPANAPFVGFAAAARAVVTELNRELPGMSLWLVTRVTEDQQLVVASAGEWAERAAAGTAYSWQASLCLRMVSGAPPLALDISSEPAYLPAAIGPLAHVRAYLGVPLLTGDGELFGTLCALGGAPQPDRWHDAMPLVSVMGRMLTTVLAGEQATREARAGAGPAQPPVARRPPQLVATGRRPLKSAREEMSSVNETCAECQICPCTCGSQCDHNCECFDSENQHLEVVPVTASRPVQW